MNKTFLSLLTAVALVPSLHAGDGKSFKETKTVITQDTCRFRDQEFQIDGFYSGIIGSSGSRFHTGSGGGFGLNYFFCRYVGVGFEAQWYSNGGVAEHMPCGGNLIFRYPICAWNLAPYVMVGGGGAWDGVGTGYGNVGGGIEYRFTDHVGVFVDGRYLYGGSGNVADIRSGIRIAF